MVPTLERAGVEVAASVERAGDAAGARAPRPFERRHPRRASDRLRRARDARRAPACVLVALSGGRACRVRAARRRVRAGRPAPGVEVIGCAAGAGKQHSLAAAYDGGGDKCFVCVCEDVTTKDLKRAIAEGFDSIELAKRYTTVTMGPCQGKLCHLNSIRLLARELGTNEAEIGTTTARPPWGPVELGLLAGRHLEPAKRSTLNRRHEQLGAEMMWTGQWRRPHSYGDAAAEVRAVHESLGIIDVSTLGKIVVEGPEAATLLERLYPNKFADLKPGRIRYGVLTTDGGRIFDDGTVARIDDELFYVTTTSTGSSGVVEWFEWWNAVWGYDVEIVNLTGAIAAMNVAGPRAREALASLTDGDISNDALRYLDARELHVAGVPCLALRIGFVGELGYELHCSAGLAEYVWDAVVAAGAVPFGLEPQRVLRLEKAHVIVTQDTDSESNLLSAGMPWIVKDDKPDFVGKWALPHTNVRERLVGFTAETLPPEGAQVVSDGRIAGRVTSSRVSERVGSAIGLCWVQPDKAEEGTPIVIRWDGAEHPATVTLSPFYDPKGTRLRS